MADGDGARRAIRVRQYGSAGSWVILVHGGPGAAGYLAPVARRLADWFQVLEPFQRGSGDELLTVARHVADLDEVVQSRCGGGRPAVVGHSWGAMLTLAYAAEHPDTVSSLVLVACGTFDPVARERLRVAREARQDEDFRRRATRLAERYPDPDARLRAWGRLYQLIDSVELVSQAKVTVACDARAHEETWADMIRLQNEGVYPAAFAAIRVPVLMLHGNADPHPGPLIRDSLTPYLPQLTYRELERCGHYPWLEVAAQEEFYAVLGEWLTRPNHSES